MPLAGFYGSELMNAGNEPASNSGSGSNKDARKGHYFAHVPADPLLQAPASNAMWSGQPVAPRNTSFMPPDAVCNNSNNLSPRTQIMHELNCA